MADRTARFSNWFQIISNVAIIVGLALIVYELNQSKQLASVQFINDDFDRLMNRQLAIISDDPREALAKAALNPNDLTERDVVSLDALYESLVLNWTNMLVTSQTANLDRPLQIVVMSDARTYLSSAPGRRWLRDRVRRADAATEVYRTPMSRDYSELLTTALGVVSDESENHYRSQYKLLLAKY